MLGMRSELRLGRHPSLHCLRCAHGGEGLRVGELRTPPEAGYRPGAELHKESSQPWLVRLWVHLLRPITYCLVSSIDSSTAKSSRLEGRLRCEFSSAPALPAGTWREWVGTAPLAVRPPLELTHVSSEGPIATIDIAGGQKWLGQAAQSSLRPVRAGSVSQRSSTGIGGRQRSPTVQRNRRSPALHLTQVRGCGGVTQIVVPKVRRWGSRRAAADRREDQHNRWRIVVDRRSGRALAPALTCGFPIILADL